MLVEHAVEIVAEGHRVAPLDAMTGDEVDQLAVLEQRHRRARRGEIGQVAARLVDGLAVDGVLFEQAIAPAPETAASHATLFTGREVQHHGVVRNGARLEEAAGTLAEWFRDAGYGTAAFVSSFVLDPRFGWGQGFDHYDASFSRAGETVKSRGGFWGEHEFEGFDRRATATNASRGFFSAG